MRTHSGQDGGLRQKTVRAGIRDLGFGMQGLGLALQDLGSWETS